MWHHRSEEEELGNREEGDTVPYHCLLWEKWHADYSNELSESNSKTGSDEAAHLEEDPQYLLASNCQVQISHAGLQAPPCPPFTVRPHLRSSCSAADCVSMVVFQLLPPLCWFNSNSSVKLQSLLHIQLRFRDSVLCLEANRWAVQSVFVHCSRQHNGINMWDRSALINLMNGV